MAAVVGIAETVTPEAALAAAGQVAASLLDAPVAVTYWIPSQGSATISCVGLRGTPPVAGTLLESVCEAGAAVRTVIEPSRDGLLADMDAGKVAIIAVPFPSLAYGGIMVARPLDDGEFGESDERLATTLAKQTVMALAAQAFAAERRRLEQALREAERLKTEFVAMTSHELRTPLTSIRAATSMIRNYWSTIAEERKLGLLEVVEGQAQRLSRMVENILASSNLEAGVVLPRIIPIDLATSAEEAARDFLVETEVEVVCERPLLAEADPDHVRQILVNFIGNSLKYGAPPIRIHGRAGRDCVELAVSDQGPGVPPEFVPRLFDKFTQASEGASRQASGSGLGLSIVRGLAEASGGSVHYQSAEPTGACFVLRLPVTT